MKRRAVALLAFGAVLAGCGTATDPGQTGPPAAVQGERPVVTVYSSPT